MKHRIYRTGQAIILALWAATILFRWITGSIGDFISLETAWLSILSVIILAYQSHAIMNYSKINNESDIFVKEEDILGLFWMLLPLLAGIFYSGHNHIEIVWIGLHPLFARMFLIETKQPLI